MTNEALSDAGLANGPTSPSNVAGSERRDSFKVLFAKSTWQIIATLVVLALLISAAGSSSPLRGSFLDAATWPGSGLGKCGSLAHGCDAEEMRRVYVSIIVFCSGLLTLLSGVTYVREVTRAERSRTSGNVDLPNWIVFATSMGAFVINALWTFAIVMFVGAPEWLPFVHELAVVVIFTLFALVDFYLMWRHIKDRYNEGRHEYDFFFGNLFFIDIPIVIGAIAVVVFASQTTFNDPEARSIIEASSAAAAVMCVALSQVVYAALQVQLRMKRQRYP